MFARTFSFFFAAFAAFPAWAEDLPKKADLPQLAVTCRTFVSVWGYLKDRKAADRGEQDCTGSKTFGPKLQPLLVKIDEVSEGKFETKAGNLEAEARLLTEEVQKPPKEGAKAPLVAVARVIMRMVKKDEPAFFASTSGMLRNEEASHVTLHGYIGSVNNEKKPHCSFHEYVGVTCSLEEQGKLLKKNP